MDKPTLRILSLGAGVQSTALLILAAHGEIPVDVAIFADTGWEPAAVYRHLARLEREVAAPAGIPILRVSDGNLRDDYLHGPGSAPSMPLHTVKNCESCGGTGTERDAPGRCKECGGTGKAQGTLWRQCTERRKLRPLMRKTRELLGAPPKADGTPGRVPRGRVAEQLIGFSTDEAGRALDSKGNGYTTSRWPLLELGLSRTACEKINADAGFEGTEKSACIGCPYHDNQHWRHVRDTAPDEFEDACRFDDAIRAGSDDWRKRRALTSEVYLHRDRVPLRAVDIDRTTRKERRGDQGDLLDILALDALGQVDSEPSYGCGPFTCRVNGDPVVDDEDADSAEPVGVQ